MKPNLLKATFAAISLTFLVSGPTVSQTEANAGTILELPTNPRAMALGNAFVLSGSDPDGLFYNPALSARAGGSSVGLVRFGSASTLITASTSSGAFLVGMQALSFGASTNPITAPTSLATLTSNGAAGSSELVASIAYARSIFGFEIGVAGKWLEERIGGEQDGGPLADVGLVREVGPLTFGVSLQNLGPDLSFDSFELPTPLRLGFGASTDVEQLGALDVALSAAVYREHDGGIMAGGGVEFAYWPITGRTFTGRIGIIHEPDSETWHVTFGGAVTLDGFATNYGFQDVSSAGSAHSAGFYWRE